MRGDQALSFDEILLQLTNIENGYMWTFIIGIPCAVWGYLDYVKKVKF
jgi:hypothetical protein